MRVLSIIVTYNASKWIDKCFGSLVNSSIPLDISVFDNNSSDDTVSLIRNKFPEVEVIETGENLGFGKANNLGLKMAIHKEYDFVLLLNQDAWIENDTVQKLINSQNENKDYAVIVPLQMNGEGTLIDSLFLKYTISDNRELMTHVFSGQGSQLHEVNFANAACWLMPLSVVHKIGGFDPLFPHYGEDDDYLNRLKFHGLKVGLDLSTFVYHDREFRTPKQTMKALVNESFTSELIDFKNHLIGVKSKSHLLKSMLVSGVKFITSAFNRYYLYKIVAYFKIFKIYDSILEHRKKEVKPFPHYL